MTAHGEWAGRDHDHRSSIQPSTCLDRRNRLPALRRLWRYRPKTDDPCHKADPSPQHRPSFSHCRLHTHGVLAGMLYHIYGRSRFWHPYPTSGSTACTKKYPNRRPVYPAHETNSTNEKAATASRPPNGLSVIEAKIKERELCGEVYNGSRLCKEPLIRISRSLSSGDVAGFRPLDSR
jgi:hypothetical protein